MIADCAFVPHSDIDKVMRLTKWGFTLKVQDVKGGFFVQITSDPRL